MRNRLWIGFAVLLYILTRCYLLTHTDTEVPQSGDAGHYYIIAQNLAAHNIYADSPKKNQTNLDLAASPPTAAASSPPLVSATWRPPLWPFVLSVWMEITSNPHWQLVLKLVFEGLLLGFVYLMLQSVELSTVISGFVLCLLAIEPHFMKYGTTFLSENLTAFLLVLLTGSFLYSVIAHSRRAALCVAMFGGLAVMSHPVVLPYVLLMVGVALFHLLRIHRFKLALGASLLFALILMSWPLRNQLVFNQGLFMTASQGAVLSKSWNDDVLVKHNNTQGDLLDEGLNVSRYPDLQSKCGSNPLQNSAIMQEATLRYMGEMDMIILIKMALWKWFCGLNPIPQTNKPGVIELMGSAFRILYLSGLFIGLYALITKRFEANTIYFWSAWILILVFAAISMTSIVLYTGLRFNSVYAPLNLVLTLFVISGFWKSNSLNDFKTVVVAQ